MTNRVRIEIIRTPEGPGIPEEIRKECIGMVLESYGLLSSDRCRSLLDRASIGSGENDFYVVDESVVRATLKAHSEKAWEWFEKNIPKLKGFEVFAFNVGDCKMLD